MREWLFNVMRELAERDELSPHYKELEQEAQVRAEYAEYKVSHSYSLSNPATARILAACLCPGFS